MPSLLGVEGLVATYMTHLRALRARWNGPNCLRARELRVTSAQKERKQKVKPLQKRSRTAKIEEHFYLAVDIDTAVVERL